MNKCTSSFICQFSFLSIPYIVKLTAARVENGKEYWSTLTNILYHHTRQNNISFILFHRNMQVREQFKKQVINNFERE
jgi:hypothetical protein